MAKFDVAAVFGEELKKVSESDTGAKLRTVDVDLIDANELNFYSTDEKALSDLKDSIALSGVMDPPSVVETEDGRYRLISGHRRTLAVRALVAEGRDDLRRMPVMVRAPSSADAEELELIMANSTTRVLTNAELNRQAERIKWLLYRLKMQGFEFPGRMRDYVAAACNVSKTKIANLEIIRERLPERFRAAYEDGKLSEDAALKICRLPAEIQDIVIKSKKDAPLAACVEACADYAQEYKKRTLACNDGEPCSNLDRKVLYNFTLQYSWQKCEPDRCCMKCHHVNNCRFACKNASEAAAARKNKEKNAAAKKEAAAKTKRERESAAFAKRLVAAADVAGIGDDVTFHLGGTAHYNTPLSALRDVAAGRDFSAISSWDPISLSYISDLLAAADKLHCSTDYLLGLTDELRPSTPTSVQWQTGAPLKEGRYWCKISCDGAVLSSQLEWTYYDGASCWRMPNGADVGAEVVGWWPLPEE